MFRNAAQGGLVIAGLLSCGLFPSLVLAQTPATPQKLSAITKSTTSPSTQQTGPAQRRPVPMSAHARDHYQLVWGVDSLDVKAVESGQMIRFSYSVLDAAKAAPLNDKKLNPSLIDEQARVRLEIPTMEKVGQLRQSSTPEVGKSYWMVFSNKGSVVKPGDRVSVIIGKFRADGLYVR
jgi:hypothetical protein